VIRPYHIEFNSVNEILVVGCGGTGGFVAEGLCRLLGDRYNLMLIDHDRIEPHNLLRQNFYKDDVGNYKSQALAERLSRQYCRHIGYCVQPFSDNLIREYIGNGLVSLISRGLVIGCVDNSFARKSIAESIKLSGWWLDAGNGEHSGQVLIGNRQSNLLSGTFDQKTMSIRGLPLPSVQQPSLLAPTVEPRKPLSCAEAVESDTQSPVINRIMADMVLQFVYLFLRGELEWMGAYIDLKSGTMNTVPAEPKLVSDMTGVPVKELITK